LIVAISANCSWRIMPNVWDGSKQKNGTAVQFADCKFLSSLDGAGSRLTMGGGPFVDSVETRDSSKFDQVVGPGEVLRSLSFLALCIVYAAAVGALASLCD
jgi:hypothetical protein